MPMTERKAPLQRDNRRAEAPLARIWGMAVEFRFDTVTHAMACVP